MNLKLLAKLAEPKTFSASILPVILGSVIAWTRFEHFNPFHFVLLLVGMCLIQGATNMINDYHDYKRSSSEAEKADEKALVNGEITLPRLKRIIFTFMLLAAGIGFYFAALYSWWILVIMMAAGLVMFAYSAGPLPISYTPFGELVAGLTMGLGITATVIYIQSAYVDRSTLLVCMPTVCYIAALLLANNLSDWQEDRMAGRRTSVICLGPKKATHLWLFLMVTPLLFTLYFSLTGLFVIWTAVPVLIGFPYGDLSRFSALEKKRENKKALMGITTLISLRYHMILIVTLLLLKALHL